MGRKTSSSSSILLGGFGIVFLVATLASVIGDVFIQWLFVPFVVVVSLWVAAAINKGQRRRK